MTELIVHALPAGETDPTSPTTRRVVADGPSPCRRCLPACPPGALIAPGVLDARRCLAALVQLPGPFPVDVAAMRGWMEVAFQDLRDGTRRPFVVIEQATDRIIGTTSYCAISEPNRFLEIGWRPTDRVSRDESRHFAWLVSRHQPDNPAFVGDFDKLAL